MSDLRMQPHPGVEPGWMTKQRWAIDADTVIRPLEAADMELLRAWRNTQQSVLRQQEPISESHQQRWFKHVVLPSYAQRRPDSLLVMVEQSGVAVSYGGLTNLEWLSRRGEVSFLADTHRSRDAASYEHDFSLFLQWLVDFSFDVLDFNRLFTETWAFRTEHLGILEAAGFRREGQLRQHVVKDGIIHDALLHGILRTDKEQRA